MFSFILQSRRVWIIIAGPGIVNGILLLTLAILNRKSKKFFPAAATAPVNQTCQLNNQARNESLVTSLAIFVILAIFVCSILFPVAMLNFRLVVTQPFLVGFSTLAAYFVLAVIFPTLFFSFHKNAVKHITSIVSS